MKICYIDEAGCCGALPGATSDIQPVLAIGGLIIDYSQLHRSTSELLNLKRRFYPQQKSADATYLSRILDEIKGSDLRKNACASGRNLRRATFGFLDGVFNICEKVDAKFVGRIWVKGIGQPFNGRAVYTSSIQAIASYFQDYLNKSDDLGIIIADSRLKHLNSQVAFSIFTQKFKGGGDTYDRIVELPTFGHSDNHAGIQIADFLCSAILTPMAVTTYCEGVLTSLHVRPGYNHIKERYAGKMNNMQHRYREASGRWVGGIVVSDEMSQRQGGLIFQNVSLGISTGPAPSAGNSV